MVISLQNLNALFSSVYDGEYTIMMALRFLAQPSPKLDSGMEETRSTESGKILLSNSIADRSFVLWTA